MYNTQGVDVGKGSVCLIGVELNQDVRDWLFHLIIVLKYSVDSFWEVIHDNI